MADNVIAQSSDGRGPTFMTDDLAGVHVPIVKLSHGALDSNTLVSTSSGLPVAQQGTWNIGTVTAVTAITDPVAVTGTFWQATQPVSLASVPSHAVTNAGTFAVQAAQSGTWDVGTVTTVTTVSTVTAVTDITNSVTVDQATASNLNAQVVGELAHDAADSGNPVKIGGKAVSALPAVVAANDRANLITDLHGRLITINEACNELLTAGYASVTDTTATEVIATAGASTKWRITAIGVYNSDATVGTWVKVQDDTAGTPVVYWRGYAAAAGGGFNLNFSPALPAKGQAAGEIHVVAETTSSEVTCNVCAYKVPG